MGVSRLGLMTRAWAKWKAIRFPWRRKFLAGQDLNGNTYWLFRITGAAASENPLAPPADNPNIPREERWRRIVEYPSGTHYSEVRVPPVWHSWLRYRRAAPPDLDEQRAEVNRRERMRILAAQADARWEAKERIAGAEAGAGAGMGEVTVQIRPGEPLLVDHMGILDKSRKGREPVKRATGPGEDWQPRAWTPMPVKKR